MDAIQIIFKRFPYFLFICFIIFHSTYVVFINYTQYLIISSTEVYGHIRNYFPVVTVFSCTWIKGYDNSFWSVLGRKRHYSDSVFTLQKIDLVFVEISKSIRMSLLRLYKYRYLTRSHFNGHYNCMLFYQSLETASLEFKGSIPNAYLYISPFDSLMRSICLFTTYRAILLITESIPFFSDVCTNVYLYSFPEELNSPSSALIGRL